MQLTCKSCGEPIPVRNINMQTMTAACEHCNAVFQFSPEDVGAEKAKRLKLERPDGITVAETAYPENFSVELNWRKLFGSMEWFSIVFLLIGGIVLSVLGLDVLFGTNPTGVVQEVLTGLDLSEFMTTLLGLGLTGAAAFCWYCLAMFAVDKTRLTLDDERLRVVHFPLYWKGQNIPRERIVAVETVPYAGFENYHTLVVVTDDGARHTLDNYQAHHATYLQQRLQRALFAPQSANTLSIDQDVHHVASLTDDGELDFAVPDVAEEKRQHS